MLKIPLPTPFQNYFKQMNIALNPTRKYKFVAISYWPKFKKG